VRPVRRALVSVYDKTGLEGTTRVLEDAASVHDAEQRYAVRYRRPRPNPERVVVVLDVDRVLGGSWPDPLPPSPYAT
ncbi:MAG TPA: hypothetical protein VNN23_07685, partial [Ornithinibacter sp.]|nr:hypothetical protein [Ornithinibacter sp.]